MDLGIKGKNALVTGGSHGIGRAIVSSLVKEGCKVITCARGELEEHNITEPFVFVRADVTVLEDIKRVFQAVIDYFGTLHILVNNVGGGGRWGLEAAEETSEEVWREVYEKNAMAAIRFTMRAIPYMREQKWGRVVTISSIHGREAGGRPWFSMAKAAEIALMKSLATDRRYKGITFNTVAPGLIKVGNPAEEESLCYGSPEDVANVVTFLCSPNAKWINGACLVVDGGEGRSF